MYFWAELHLSPSQGKHCISSTLPSILLKKPRVLAMALQAEPKCGMHPLATYSLPSLPVKCQHYNKLSNYDSSTYLWRRVWRIVWGSSWWKRFPIQFHCCNPPFQTWKCSIGRNCRPGFGSSRICNTSKRGLSKISNSYCQSDLSFDIRLIIMCGCRLQNYNTIVLKLIEITSSFFKSLLKQRRLINST